MQHLNTLLYFEMYIGNNKKVIKTDEVSAKSLKAEKAKCYCKYKEKNTTES